MVIVMSGDGGARQFGRLTARRTPAIGQVMAQPQEHSLALLLEGRGERAGAAVAWSHERNVTIANLS